MFSDVGLTIFGDVSSYPPDSLTFRLLISLTTSFSVIAFKNMELQMLSLKYDLKF